MNYSDISTNINSQIKVSNFLAFENNDELIAEIFLGLFSQQKYISSRFFYDDSGSSLFEDITNLPEYYPTRTEKSILRQNANKIVGIDKNLSIIELGSGDCSKISILIDAVNKSYIENLCYIPVDVSEAAILKSADILSLKYPKIKIHGLLADFMKHLNFLPDETNRLICFFGSTLGNLTRMQAVRFLMNLKKLLHPGDRFLLGLDMQKDTKILEDAYNDKQGVTESFNRNILNVINEIAGTNLNPELFEHIAIYNSEKSRIEMHLRALQDMVIKSPAFSKTITLTHGETIHTENSHKYNSGDIYEFAGLTGLKIKNIFTDTNHWFSLVEFECLD